VSLGRLGTAQLDPDPVSSVMKPTITYDACSDKALAFNLHRRTRMDGGVRLHGESGKGDVIDTSAGGFVAAK